MMIPEWFAKGSNLVSLGALVTALTALTRTWSTSRTAKKNLSIAIQQEARRAIDPQVELMQSKRRELDGFERYSFLVHIGNSADSGNFVARAEMGIDYRTPDGVVTTVKIPAERVQEEEVKYLGNESSLEVPVNVSARAAIEGWIHFKFASNLMSGNDVDRFVIVLEMGHGRPLVVESIIPADI
ncbi:hypothetical protein [Streptomyces sp. NBC_00459]|uniref:hypothetical protein n=1 Tax=Streptomyces sp. NBC_00459 TaxID=2975749 RepID=UPI002E17CF39